LDCRLGRISESISLAIGELRHHLIEIKALKGRLVILASFSDAEIMPGATRSSMDERAAVVLEAEKVLVF
jgi:hypothetical protein